MATNEITSGVIAKYDKAVDESTESRLTAIEKVVEREDLDKRTAGRLMVYNKAFLLDLAVEGINADVL